MYYWSEYELQFLHLGEGLITAQSVVWSVLEVVETEVEAGWPLEEVSV